MRVYMHKFLLTEGLTLKDLKNLKIESRTVILNQLQDFKKKWEIPMAR